MPLTQQQIDAIESKLCPTGMEDALLHFLRETTNLKHENTILKEELKELNMQLLEK